MFYSVVYVSTAVELLSASQLAELLNKCRAYNCASDITGMLLYKDGNFMQVLEGTKDEVLKLFDKVKQDPRHHSITVLLQQELAEREFDHWAMGFKTDDPTIPREEDGYTEFIDLPLDSEEFIKNAPNSLKLLLSFKKVVR